MSKNWYVVHTYSGFEKFVAESIRQRALEMSIEDQVGQIIIPTEDVIEIKGGKKVVSTKRSYPGYITNLSFMLSENIFLPKVKKTGFYTPEKISFLYPWIVSSKAIHCL